MLHERQKQKDAFHIVGNSKRYTHLAPKKTGVLSHAEKPPMNIFYCIFLVRKTNLSLVVVAL